MNDNSINIDYNKYYTETLSSSQMSDIRERHNTEDMLQSLAVTGGVVGLGAYGYNQAKKSNKVLEMVENLPGAKLLTERLQNGYQGAEYIQPPSSSGGPQPLSRSLHSMLLAAEEASPLHIAKTLGLSSFQTLFVDVVDQEKQTIKIGSDSIRAYSEYYRNLVLNSSGYALTRKDIQNGFLLEGNKLFLANKDGTKGREIAGYARIISTNTTIGHQDSPNRVFQKFANIVGADVHVSQFKQEPLAIVAGTNKAQVMQDWSRAYARFGTEIGFKVLDNPLGFIEEMSGNLGVDTQNSKLFNNKFVTTFKRHINLGLGANGVYNKGNREAMKIMAKNLGIKATGAYTSYVTVNHLLEKITGEDNPWHNGIGAGITHMYAKMRIGFAKVWSDNLQYIREEQEEAAPESTNLMSLAALPLGGAMLGANIAYFKRMRDIASKGFDEGARINTEIKKFDGTVGKILDKVKLNPKGTTLARYGKLGALAGAALTIPFLPGALVGRSSEELRAEFEGTSDVAVRRNRSWVFGGEAYEGGQIKYHRKSLVKESVTDARNKTLYKDGDQQRDMDPLASPFKYLKNPYAFEEAHQHDMPYAVWGMDVTYGSFMGKIFQGTIGQLLKPTIVNPELEKYVTNVEQRLEGELSTTQSLTGTVIKKGEAPVKAITGTSEEGGEAPYTRGDQIAIPVKESRKDVAMQKDGIMLTQSSATVDPTKEAMVGAYAAFSDFTGLKGFTSSSVMDAMGLDPTDQTAPKLAVSGSANTLVDRYQSMQLGDAMGCFVPGTCVYWEEGYLPIEKVKVGYRLVSKNGKLRIVSKVYTKEVNEEILKTTLEDGTIIYSTINHVFPGYKKTNTLAEKAIVLWEVGDKLIRQTPVGSSERLTITSQELIWYKGPVYDLEMSESFLEPSTAHTNYYTVEDILCHNSGEFIRRLLPQSADTRGEEVNPMRNSIAASWLPRDAGRDFGEGNYYEKHEAGYTMLPGSRGFEALHPELKGVDPENYSDAWKYRILQNVARGSKEHNIYRDKLIKEVDTLSDYDKNIFFTAYEQDMARSEEKKFFEHKTEEDKAKMNLFQLAQNTLWESVSHLESPTEPLTPFRPMAKFLHQRTAIEDYRRTQLAGSDAAIWTKPIDHFINPTINRHIQLLDEFYKPRDVQEKESIDEYFDNLKLVKSSQGRPYDANNTIVSAAYSGMRNAADMEAFKRALPDNQKAYVESFASERDEKKRSEILEMLPSNIGRVYKSIWANIDEYDNAVSSGQDPNKRLRDLYLREAEALKKETGITLTRQEIEGINKASYEIRDKEERENFIAEEQAAKVRAKAAQQEAQDYVEEVTGTPDSSWIGWDNRLTIDDIKLKTLSIGKEDITRFGYWSEEQQRNDRIVALDNDTQVVNRLKEIKKELRDNQDNKHLLKRRLRDEGYDVHDISTTPGAGTVNINND